MDKPITRSSLVQDQGHEAEKDIAQTEVQISSDAQKPIIMEALSSDSKEVHDSQDTQSDASDCEEDFEDEDDNVNFVADNNNRFALILERMELLEKENEILKARNLDHEKNEKKHIEETYEKEIKDTRKLLDDMAQDKANMELDLARLDHDLKDVKLDSAKHQTSYSKVKDELDRLKELHAQKERYNSELKRELKDLQKTFSALTMENRQAIEERKEAFSQRDMHEADAKKLRSENKDLKEKVAALEKSQASLKKEVDETRTACQDEALKRVNCENQIATLSETLDFERKISKDKLMESRGNDSFAANVESAVNSRIAQALEEMRCDHEAELESTVNKLKYESKLLLKAHEHRIQELQEKQRELSSNLKNSEITRANLEKSKKYEVMQLKKTVEGLESDVDTLRASVDFEKAEREKVTVDLQSRKAVWCKSEGEYLVQIKNLRETLDSKGLQEKQLRSELNKMSALMTAAEKKHNVPSPDRGQMRQIRKSKKNSARNKRRLSQMKLNDLEQQSTSSISTFTPVAKKPNTGAFLVQDNDTSISKEISVNAEENSAAPAKVANGNQECRIM